MGIDFASADYYRAAGALPVKEAIPALHEALAKKNTVLLEAPPGAGKSTLVPLTLLELPWVANQKIYMLEPRRLAARAVATRMAQLLGEPVGQTVGYRIRFEARVSAQTKIEVVTESILTRMLQEDNALEGVAAVLFDEFHERSLQADVALALSRECQSILRPDLRLLIMSATLDVAGLASLLAGSEVVQSAGKMYPVEVHYRPSTPDISVWGKVASAIREALKAYPNGDILAFLPGQGEIERCREALENQQTEAVILPLYGDLTAEAQQRALLPIAGRRKVILATSIAETSLTIEGVAVVIDSGLARVPKFDPRSGFTRLETQPISQDSATQRAGRAGRLGPGVCYRLWSEASQAHLPAHRTPEILEADLAPVILDLAAWGHAETESLSWLTPPPKAHVAQAKEVLQELGAIEANKITNTGKRMLRLPTHPRLAHLLLEGAARGWDRLAAQIAALLEDRDLLGTNRLSADLTERLEALNQGKGDKALREKILRLAQEWERQLQRLSSFPNEKAEAQDHYSVGLLVAAAYPERIARQRSGTSYRLANGRAAKLPDQDPLDREQWLAVASLDGSGGEGKIFLAAPLDPKSLLPLAKMEDNLSWDEKAGKIVAQREWKMGPLLLKSQPTEQVSEEAKAKVLCAAIRAQGLSLIGWGQAEQQWQLRVLTLRAWHPEEEWPDVSESALLQTLETWLAPYLGPVRKAEDYSKLPIKSLAANLLSWAQGQELEKRAPEAMMVPTGSNIQLAYRPDGEVPILAVRLQEMFGMAETPSVDNGRKPVLLHLLSPGYKPVQVTQNLASFWANTYADVRKDLRGRYPKHSWPDNPLKADPIRGAKKRPQS